MLTQEFLRERYSYNQETGVFLCRYSVSLSGPHAGEVAGSVDTKGYVIIKILGKPYKAHRLAWLYIYGELPKERLDHKDHIKTNNAILNLRKATASQNHANTPKRFTNTSGFKGVFKHYKRWRAAISKDGKRYALGRFKTPEEAYKAYKIKALELYGEFAKV